MALKKGQKIWSVHIENGIVSAITKDAESISLTRNQRKVLTMYKKPSYIDLVCKEFSHNDPLAPDFSVIVDGELVYER